MGIDAPILDLIEKRIGVVNGTLLSAVEDPFRFPLLTHAVYIAKTDQKIFAGIDKVTHGRLVLLELDEWMTSLMNGVMGAIWPIAPRSVVNVLYRDQSFDEIAMQAEKCITARFFDPDKFNPWIVEPILRQAAMQQLSFEELKNVERIVREHFCRYGTAIHFLRTGDIETDYNVLKSHFYEDDLNVLELTENRQLSWPIEAIDKLKNLHAELRGALAVSKIDWEADLSELLKLGQMVMQLRTAA